MIETAKVKVKKQLFDANMAVPYYETEGEVISRTRDTCIVAKLYQWFFRYGEEEWREATREHVVSDHFQAYNKKTQFEFE